MSTPMFSYYSFFGDTATRKQGAPRIRSRLRMINTPFSNVMPILPDKDAPQITVNAAWEATIALDKYHEIDASPTAFADLLDLRNRAQYLAPSVSRLPYALGTQYDPDSIKVTEALVQENVRPSLLIQSNLTLYSLPLVNGLADGPAHQLKTTLEFTQ